MLLAIDVGNTQTVVGIYQDGSLQYRWRVATNKSHTSDELRVKLVPLLVKMTWYTWPTLISTMVSA